MINKEQLYTSTQNKLLHNLDRLKEMQRGYFRPVSIQLAPTNRCNLSCIMCSVANRDKNEELSLDQCRQILVDFKKLGAKTVENSGGGDPTMYPYINDLIALEHHLGYEIGFITNGVKLSNITTSNLEKLTWLRISLNSLDYVEDININVPSHVTLGFSYVITDLSSEEQLEKIAEYADKYNATYVRIVPNCLSVEDINKSTDMILPYLEKYPKFFFQQKKYTVPKNCYMGRLKPFVCPDGFVYQCSANPLIDRKFNAAFRVCSIEDITKTWENSYGNFKAFNTCNCQEGKCFFAEHNNLIDQVVSPCEHYKFI
jgi:MoaA/NifB/PqqE/SkfB family radical SAM enzyme